MFEVLLYVLPLGLWFLPLLVVATRSRSHAVAALAVSPVVVALAMVVVGFYWTAGNVSNCVDCSSDLSLLGLKVLGNSRANGGFGGNFYAGLGWLMGGAVVTATGLGFWLRPATSHEAA